MAKSGDINQRIILTGADEVRRHLEEIAKQGQRSGNTIRSALLAATSGAGGFTDATQASTKGARNLQFALTNLSFQVNDVVSGLVSGQDAMRIFAQQGGQIFQIFQQAGPGVLLGKIKEGLSGIITPMRLAVAGATALAAGFVYLAAKAVEAEQSTRDFNVILKGLGNTSQTTGEQLEAQAHTMHDIGLSTSEARAQMQKALQEGVRPEDTARIVRIGKELNAVLGEGSMERFISAAGKGGEPLQEIAKQLNIIPKYAADTSKALADTAKSFADFMQSITDEIKKQNDELRDLQRDQRRDAEDAQRERANTEKDAEIDVGRQIEDLNRRRGDALYEINFTAGRRREDANRQRQRREEEQQIRANRRIEDINRRAAQAINELIRKRNKQNAEELKKFNDEVLASAQKALGDQSLITQIGQRVGGLSQERMGALAKAVTALSTAWDKLIVSLAQSGAITVVVSALQAMVTGITSLIKGEGSLAAMGAALIVLTPLLYGVAAALRAIAVAAIANPWTAIIAGIVALGVIIYTQWPVIVAAFQSFIAWVDAIPLSIQRAGESMGGVLGGIVKNVGTFLLLIQKLIQGDFAGAMEEWKRLWKDTLTLIFETMIDAAIQAGKNKLLEFWGWLIQKAKDVASFFGRGEGGGITGRDFGGGGDAPIIRGATGGLVSGPGTGTSDSVMARLSNGEFIMPALSTRMYLPLLEAMRSMSRPIRPSSRLPRGFAGGGMVRGGGGATVNLYIGGNSYPLSGDRGVVDALTRAARRSSMLSAGRKPSTA